MIYSVTASPSCVWYGVVYMQDGDTALHYACFMGCGSVVSLLLSELKASLNVKDKVTTPALSCAVLC